MKNKICTEENCTNDHYARGFCHSHYSKKRKSGELELIVYPTECSVAGCSDKPRTKGMCHKHYERTRRSNGVEQNYVVQGS